MARPLAEFTLSASEGLRVTKSTWGLNMAATLFRRQSPYSLPEGRGRVTEKGPSPEGTSLVLAVPPWLSPTATTHFGARPYGLCPCPR